MTALWTRSAVPAAAHVPPDPTGAVVGRARGAVPEIGVMQEHVAAVAIHADLAGHLLEAGGHAGGSTPVRTGHDAQETVLGRGCVEMDRERDRRPPVEGRARLRIGMPADARVPGAIAGTGVLVDDAEAIVFEQPAIRTEESLHCVDEDWMGHRDARLRRDGRDLADVVRERLPVD